MAPGFRVYKQSSAVSSSEALATTQTAVGKQTLVSSQYGTIAAVTDERHAQPTLELANRILNGGGSGWAYKAPRPAVGALLRLNTAVVGDPDRKLTTADRLVLFDEAIQALAPAAAIVKQADDWWHEQHYAQHVRYQRGNLVRAIAHEDALAARKRVDDAVLAADNRVIDVPTEPLDGGNAKHYADVLRPTIAKLIKNASRATSIVEKVAKHKGDRASDLPGLERAMDVLKLIELSIDLPDAVERINRRSDDLGETVRDYAHFIKVGVDAAKTATELTAKVGAWAADRVGRLDLAKRFIECADRVAGILTVVVNVADAVDGCMALIDPDSNLSERIDGAVTMTAGGLGAYAGVAKLFQLSGGGLAGVAGVGLKVGYELWKLDMLLHAKVGSDLAIGGLAPRFAELASSAIEIQRRSDTLIKACQLRDQATHARQRTAFDTVVADATRELDGEVDTFLAKCVRITTEISVTRPGENPHLREKFAPLRSLRGASATPEAALGKALAVVTTIVDVLEDAHNYVRLGMGLDRKARYENDKSDDD